MAEEQIQIERMSPTGVEPETQQEEEAPRTLTAFDTAETVAEPEIKANQREEQPVQMPEITPAAVPEVEPGPTIPPGRFVDMAPNVESDDELISLRDSTADFYRNYILGENLPEGGSLDRRMELINNSTYYRVPELDAEGNLKKSADGKVVYASKAIPFVQSDNPNNRVLQMFELARSNNGVYHFFTGDPEDQNARAIGTIDIGLQKMQRESQNPLGKFLSRRETEEGGMKNYINVLKRAGFKDPARLTYLAREQAKSDTIFEGIEATRTGAGFRDMAKFFADIGYGEGFQVPFTDTKIGLGKPLVDFTASIPLRLMQATNPELWFSKMSFDEQEKAYMDVVDRITGGNISWETFDDAATALQKQYPHITKQQAEAILTYSPDLVTTLSRFTAESVAIGGSMTAFMRQMGRAERIDFVDYVREITKSEDKFSDIGTAVAKLEEKGMDAGRVLAEYYDKRGVRGGYSNLVSKALDMDVYYAARRPGPYFDNVVKPKLDDAKARLDAVETKLEAAYEQGRSSKLIDSLEAQKKVLQKDILDYKSQSYLPPYVRAYIKDEGIATVSGAIAYQAVYDASNNDTANASIAAFLTSVTTSLPFIRNMGSATIEDLALAFKANGDDLATSRAAVKIRRHLENAPPEMREQILLFMEDKAVAIEELSSVRFPKGHPKAGQPVIPEDALDQSFAHMSGLLTLRRLEKDLAESSLNIQKDAGKFSENLYSLEQNFMQQSKLVDGMAQYLDALRYYKFSDAYDPNSEAGRMIDVLDNFYKQTITQLDDRKVMLKDALSVRDRDLNKFFAGNLPIDEMEGLLDGTDQLSQLLSLDRARYIDANVAPDATIEQRLNAIQAFYKDVNAKINDAFEGNSRFTFYTRKDEATANKMFRSFLTKEESRAYAEASAMFDALRSNPLYRDSRMDLTEVLDSFITQGASGELGINTRGLANVMPIYGEGTQTSRYLAKLNLPGGTSRALNRLFDESAGEYLDDFSKRVKDGSETLQKILDDAELDEAASNLDKWFAVRNFFEENSAEFGDAAADLAPRLGVAPDVFMHVVSSLGSSGKDPKGIAARQLRADLLERAPDEFFDNFYAPKSERGKVEGFADDYKKARRFYDNRYIVPFREESSVVKTLARNPDTAIRRNALDQWLKEVGAADEGVDLTKLNENFYKTLEDITGGPIDVTTDIGKQIRAVLTKHVQAEIARTPASKAIRDRLIRQYGEEGKSALIKPEDVQEIQRGISSDKTPLLNNLLRRDPNTGEYLFRDINGEPLIDPSVVNTNSFDELVGYGFREVEEAMTEVRERINTQSDEMLRNMERGTGELIDSVNTRKEMVKRLGLTDQGLGSGLISLAKQDNGIAKIAQLRDDFVYTQVQKGVDGDVARANFDQAAKEATLEHVLDAIMKPGPNIPSKTIDMATGEPRMIVQRAADMDLEGLGRLLGISGDTVGMGRQQSVMRSLLGDEVYDHIKLVHNQLYNFEPKNQGSLLVTGKSIPLSAESMLSRGTSFFRGVISLRWLISEAAIRSSREANYQLTKMMLGNPKVGREVLQMLTERKFDLDKRDPEFVSVLLTEIAKFDALQEYAAMEGEKQPQPNSGVENQMQELQLQP